MQICDPPDLCVYCRVHAALSAQDPRSASLLQYFSSRPPIHLQKLFADGWAAQGILRSLPPLARLYAMRLVMPSAAGIGLPTSVMNDWKKPTREAEAKHDQAVQLLSKLRLIERVGAPADAARIAELRRRKIAGEQTEREAAELAKLLTHVKLRKDFATSILDCLRVGGVLAPAAPRWDEDERNGSAAPAAEPVTIAALDKYARERWENVLSTILEPDEVNITMVLKPGAAERRFDSDGAGGVGSFTMDEFNVCYGEVEGPAKWNMKKRDMSVFDPLSEPLSLLMKGDTNGTMHILLGEAELIQPIAVPDGNGNVQPCERYYAMTRDAARFLLLPTHTQVWRVLRAYIDLAEGSGKQGVHHATLCFLMRLGLLELGKGYDDASLDELSRRTLDDMVKLGLAYRPPLEPNIYYATPLAQHHLSSGGAAASTASAAVALEGGAAGSSSGADASSTAGGGFLVLETNFRLYAYTSSPLWARVLKLFTHTEYLLPNLIVGSLTREALHNAIDKGISASDVEAFLNSNAHARMLQKKGEEGGAVMPETVIDQLHLWARERHRLSINKCALFQGFRSVEEFNAAETYAKDSSGYLWSKREAEGRGCALAVKEAVKGDLKSFVKSWRASNAQQTNAGPVLLQ